MLASAFWLAACDMPPPTGGEVPRAVPRPLERPAPPEPPEPSEVSRALALYYARLEADLLAKGLLRTDSGPRDAPFAARDLARNFELIAFFDEYERGAGLRASSGMPVPLRRWAQPVRVNVEFGPGVSLERRSRDRQVISDFATRLSRASRHPVLMDDARPNMHIMFYSEDDRDLLVQRARQLVPGMSPGALSVFRTLPRQIHCFVMAFSGSGAETHVYRQAIVFIRAEHPPLLRDSCIHEEMAQGLGLANDTPRARPSIFNDDDEFALLTAHDELLLRMLYDPRLRPGMMLDEARPIIATLADDLMGGGS